MEHEPIADDVEAIGRTAIDAAMKVHSVLGPGLLESAYAHCLSHELEQRGIHIRREATLPIIYEGKTIDAGYRVDFLLAGAVILEIKSVESIAPIYQAQLLTYMKLSRCRLGYLMNFNVRLFKDGIKRFVL